MRRLIFTTAKGQSVQIDASGLFLLTSLDGLGNIQEEEDNRRSPGQDGETFVECVFGPRSVLIGGYINSVNETTIYNARRSLAKVFNPKLGLGTLMVYLDSGTFLLRNAKASLPKFPERGNNPTQGFIIEVVGKDPYWYSPTYNLEELGGWEGGLEFNDDAGGLEFPIVDGVETGIEFETSAATAEITVQNNGDVPTWIEAWFKGPLTQAKLINETTGEYILVERELAKNEELYVCTKQKELDVAITNLTTGIISDGWGHIGEENTFIQLQTGENALTYDATGADSGTSVKVRYRDRFVGI